MLKWCLLSTDRFFSLGHNSSFLLSGIACHILHSVHVHNLTLCLMVLSERVLHQPAWDMLSSIGQRILLSHRRRKEKRRKEMALQPRCELSDYSADVESTKCKFDGIPASEADERCTSQETLKGQQKSCHAVMFGHVHAMGLSIAPHSPHDNASKL